MPRNAATTPVSRALVASAVVRTAAEQQLQKAVADFAAAADDATRAEAAGRAADAADLAYEQALLAAELHDLLDASRPLGRALHRRATRQRRSRLEGYREQAERWRAVADGGRSV